jgi:glycosyltransferase involved in cell wall biosynthesis
MDVSFIIPSNKPYEEFAKKVIDCIFSFSTDIKYEILYISPKYVSDSRVVYIPDYESIGATHAINKGAKFCKGDLICCMTDDLMPVGNIFEIYKFYESHLKNDRYSIGTLPSGPSHQLAMSEPGGVCHIDILSKFGVSRKIDSFVVPCLPVVSRDTFVNVLGSNIFHPGLKYFGDWWLGAFVHLNEFQIHQYNFVVMNNIGGDNHKMFPSIFSPHGEQKRFYDESYVNYNILVENYRKGFSYLYGGGGILSSEYINTIINH